MSDFATYVKETTARKEHYCFLCVEPIHPGEKQLYWKCCSDGRFYEIRVHPECYAFLKSFCNDTCSAGCDGMSEECMWEARLDLICHDCPDRRDDYRDRCRVAHCKRAAEEVKRIGGELIKKEKENGL